MYGPCAVGFGEWYVYEPMRGAAGEGSEGGIVDGADDVDADESSFCGDGERDIVWFAR